MRGEAGDTNFKGSDSSDPSQCINYSVILVCVCNVKAVGEFFAVCFYHLNIIQLSVIFCICGILNPRYCQEITRTSFRRFDSSLLGQSAILNISPRKSTIASLGLVKQMSIAISHDFDMYV